MPVKRKASFSTAAARSSLIPLRHTRETDLPEPLKAYREFYSLDMDVRHHIGTFTTQQFTCAAQEFVPEKPRGTVFLLHGYYDHSGILAAVIRACIEQNLAVAVFDLPGHGLSTGTPASISDFSQYTTACIDFFNLGNTRLAKPYYLIAHSTGAAIAYEYLYHTGHPAFTRTIFLAPLIRCSFYRLSRIGYYLMKPFSATAPRWFRNASSDKAFLRFFYTDPLQCRHFPVEWAGAYYAWVKKVKQYATLHAAVHVIQGTCDTTVDWRYNIRFLMKKIPGLTVTYIKNARHQLMNEGEPVFGEFLASLRKALDCP